MASSANKQPVVKGGVSPDNTAALPIPPPPPGGWSGVCKTVINPASGVPKVSVLASADQVSKQVCIQKEDAETLKIKKDGTPERCEVGLKSTSRQVGQRQGAGREEG